jgi:hypothetical protein
LHWLALLYFFLSAAVVNAWCIQYTYKQQQGAARLPVQLFFCERLYQQLFTFAAEANAGLPIQCLDTSQKH